MSHLLFFFPVAIAFLLFLARGVTRRDDQQMEWLRKRIARGVYDTKS